MPQAIRLRHLVGLEANPVIKFISSLHLKHIYVNIYLILDFEKVFIFFKIHVAFHLKWCTIIVQEITCEGVTLGSRME